MNAPFPAVRKAFGSPTTIAALLAIAIGLSSSAAAVAQQRAIVFEASRLLVAPGTTLEDPAARIAIRDGKIIGVGDEIPADLLGSARRLQFEGATIAPGMLVVHDYLELRSDLGESISAFTPGLEAADAFDPFDEALVRHTEGGVTAIGLAPASTGTFSGLGTVVQWRPAGGDIVEDTTYLKIALVSESLDQDRYPTSRMGAADLIRQSFAAMRSPLAPRDIDHRRLAEVLDGSRRLAVHARTFAEIVEALDLAAEIETAPLILGGDESGELIDRLREQGASLALAPLSFESKNAQLTLPARLAAAGIEFSFLGNTAESLRRSAALAIRSGLPRATAFAAVTRIPAQQLGVADRLGALRVGFAADLAVWSGPPLDLGSRPLEVRVAGVRVPPPQSATGANGKDGDDQ